jgi:hypothetical protein
MQVSGLGISPTVSSLYANEGVAAFWKGLPFAWGREIFYTSIKLGGKLIFYNFLFYGHNF